MDRLSSRANLLNRGVKITCARCVLCDMENEVETVEHCLCLCPKAKLVWSKVWSWWRISSTPDAPIQTVSGVDGFRTLGELKVFDNYISSVCLLRF
ncbi:RNA-directed DNA polymerase, eukaryota, reverse transcriptase zinc-binding domain protein [Tanacetum coccineum]